MSSLSFYNLLGCQNVYENLPVSFMTSQSETMVHFDKVDTDTSFFVVDYTTGVPCGGKSTYQRLSTIHLQ